MTTTITPAIRFAAHNYVRAQVPVERYMASQPSLVESFPASYAPELVARAQALLVRMAAAPVEATERAVLRGDLAAFHADVDAGR